MDTVRFMFSSFLNIFCPRSPVSRIRRASYGYHDDEDVGDIEAWSSGSMSPTRERRMSTHLSRVTLVELVDDALERLHFVVQSPLLLVHERLHVDRRRLPVVVFQFHFFLQTLRHDRHRQILHRDKRNIAVTVGNNRLMGTGNYSFTSNNMT